MSLWATNQEVPFTVALHCKSRSCWNWPCSYRIPDRGAGGCSKVYRNSCSVTLHHCKHSLLLSARLQKPVLPSFRDIVGHPRLPSVKDCLVLPFVPSLWVDPSGGGRDASSHLTKASMGLGVRVYFLLASWWLGVIPIGLYSFLVSLGIMVKFTNWVIGSLIVPYRITHSFSKITISCYKVLQ